MLDDYTRAHVNRAIEDALRPRGMSTHSGKVSIDAGTLQRLIVMIDRSAEGQQDAEKRIAELEREVTEQARLLGISGSVEARLLARVAELEQQLAEAQKDARRYRWLREQHVGALLEEIPPLAPFTDACDALDAAIDAAMGCER